MQMTQIHREKEEKKKRLMGMRGTDVGRARAPLCSFLSSPSCTMAGNACSFSKGLSLTLHGWERRNRTERTVHSRECEEERFVAGYRQTVSSSPSETDQNHSITACYI